MTLIATCLVLITLALWIGLAALAFACLHVWRAARAVEVQAYELGDHLDRLRDVTSAAGQFAGLLRSRWVRGLGLALGAATTYYTVRARREEAAARSNGRG